MIGFLFGILRIAVIFGLVAAVTAVAVTAMLIPEPDLNESSRAFAHDTILEMARHWDAQQFLERSSAELRKEADPERVRETFETAARIGAFKHLMGLNGEAMLRKREDGEVEARAAYVSRGQFEHGSITFQLDLIKEDGQWRIAEASIRSQGYLDFIDYDTQEDEEKEKQQEKEKALAAPQPPPELSPPTPPPGPAENEEPDTLPSPED